MNCEKYQILTDAFIEGELDEKIYEPANSHIRVCPRCADYRRAAEREKEIYAHYLFDVEPPPDLWTKFRVKLDNETETILPLPVAKPRRKINFAGFSLFYPAMGFAATLLVAFGIVSVKFSTTESDAGNQSVAEIVSNNVRKSSPAIAENAERDLTDQNDNNKTFAAPKAFKTGYEKAASTNRKQIKIKSAPIKTPERKGKIVSDDKIDDKTDEAAVASRQNAIQIQLSALEKSAAEQIEKTELLLRSFRNARLTENGSVYDVGYEKRQARRLLEKNFQLRQSAGNFGDFQTQEILEKIEPLLLDIANLENASLPEKVLDIKERVREQNIIASLQSYQ